MNEDRVGVFGGTFDPPHLGHIQVALTACAQFHLSRVLWIPAFESPHKIGVTSTPVALRVEMTKLCIQDYPQFELSLIEVERGGTSFTVDTLERIHRVNPDVELFLILGSDTYGGLKSWKHPARIQELAELIVYPRGDLDMDARVTMEGERYERNPPDMEIDGNSGNVHLLSSEKITISSSDIRQRISHDMPFQDLVALPVGRFITEQSLYRKDETN